MDDYLTMQKAAEHLGVSYWTVYRLVKAGTLRTYASPVNRRVKLVRRADLEALRQPRLIADAEGKAAA